MLGADVIGPAVRGAELIPVADAGAAPAAIMPPRSAPAAATAIAADRAEREGRNEGTTASS